MEGKLIGKKKRRISDMLLYAAVYGAAAFTVLVLLGLLIYVLVQGLPHVSWTFLTTPYQPGRGLTGIWPMIVATVQLVFVTILLAAPIGVGAAVYLNEYAKPGKLVDGIRFAVSCLAGIPSILYGLFGLTLFVTMLNMGYSLLAGALTLAILTLPTLIRTSEEALRAVPVSYREGSLALGVTKLRTTMRVVLPSALPGIATAIVLSIGRIVGETAAVYYTLGLAKDLPVIRSLHDWLFSSGRTLSVHLYLLAKEGTSQSESFAAAAVLLILVALINAASRALSARMRKQALGEK